MACILIVDDNPTNLRLAGSVLELEGHEIHSAEDGVKALEFLATRVPDLILMDIALPGIDGITLTQMIKSRPGFAAVPVVALTAFAMKGDEAKARAAGCAGYLTKPIDTRNFGAQVRGFLQADSGIRCVLIVDDIPANRRLLQAQLESEGLEVIQAEHGEEALQRLREERVDGIVSDILMPRMDGYRLCMEVRKDPILAELPLLLYTSTYNSPADRDLARSAGADAYISKPAPVREIMAALQAARHRDRPAPRPLDELEAPVLKQYSESLIRKLEERSAQLGAAYEGLANTEARLSGLIESALDAIVAVDAQRRVLLFNAAAERLFGIDRAEIAGEPMARLFDDPASIEQGIGEPGVRTLQACRRGGERFSVEAAISSQSTSRGPMVTLFLRDIGERLRAQRALEGSESRLRRVNLLLAVRTGIANLIVRSTDPDELLRDACRIAVDEGLAKAWIGIDDASGRIRWRAGHGGPPEFAEEVKRVLEDEEAARRALWHEALAERRTVIINDLAASPRALRSAVESGSRSLAAVPLLRDKRVFGVLVIHSAEVDFFDEPEARMMQELAGELVFALDHLRSVAQIRYLAEFDVLTDLRNRAGFIDRLLPLLQGATGDPPQGVMLLDIERFRRINESHGRAAGDAVLRELAERLARHAALLARVGADAFAVYLPPARSVSDLARQADELLQRCFAAPFDIGGEDLRLGGRAGIALFVSDGDDPETLLRNAEAAARRARGAWGRCTFYSPELSARAAQELTLETRLRRAYEQNQFLLHYQPKIDLATRAVLGVEALIRWQDPERGLVAPGLFIPVLEECGLITEVGDWAVREALQQQLRWRAQGLNTPVTAVNVSPLQLRSARFADELIAACAAHAEAVLEIEITESVIMEDVERSIEALTRLRDAGISIAVDDFGTGYSSLAYIARLPVQALKIDRSFITAMTLSPEGHAIVSSIIALAHALRLKVVAEGVETEEQARMLRLLGCEQAQGYLFCRPLPAEALIDHLRAAVL